MADCADGSDVKHRCLALVNYTIMEQNEEKKDDWTN